MPKLFSMVSTSLFGSVLLNAELIRFCRVVPAIFTHKSLGNERIAARFELGSIRIIMIVSLRSPRLERSPIPPVVELLASAHDPLSEPVNKKFFASRLFGSSGKSAFAGESFEPCDWSFGFS